MASRVAFHPRASAQLVADAIFGVFHYAMDVLFSEGYLLRFQEMHYQDR